MTADEQALAHALLVAAYDQGAAVADRVEAARRWAELYAAAGEPLPREHGEVGFLALAFMGGPLPERLDAWEEPTPPAGWPGAA